MRRRMGMILIWAFWVTAPSAAADEALFSKANAHYQAGDFKAAAGLYEELIASKRVSAATYFNLGNAHLRMGHKAKALIYYRAAESLAPRDADIAWNIHVLQSLLTDRIDEDSANLFKRTLQKVLGFLSMEEAALLLSVFFTLLFLGVLFGFVWPTSRFPFEFFQGAVLAGLVVSALLLHLKWSDQQTPRVVILDKEIFAKNGPSVLDSNAFTLHEGAEARVQDESKDWYYVTLANQNSGWIPKESCEVLTFGA